MVFTRKRASESSKSLKDESPEGKRSRRSTNKNESTSVSTPKVTNRSKSDDFDIPEKSLRSDKEIDVMSSPEPKESPSDKRRRSKSQSDSSDSPKKTKISGKSSLETEMSHKVSQSSPVKTPKKDSKFDSHDSPKTKLDSNNTPATNTETPTKRIDRPRRSTSSPVKTPRKDNKTDSLDSPKTKADLENDDETPTKSVGTSRPRRSTHLLVTPIPQVKVVTPTSKSQVRILHTRKLNSPEGVPSPIKNSPVKDQTSNRKSQTECQKPSEPLKETIAENDENSQLQSPTKNSPNTPTDNIDAKAATSKELAKEMPTKHSRKLSEDEEHAAPSQAETPTIRSRRSLTGQANASQQLRRSLRVSTDKADSPYPHVVLSPIKKRLKCLSVEPSKDSEIQSVQTPTRRSRRLSIKDDDLPQTPNRRSRRLSVKDDDLPQTPAKHSEISPEEDGDDDAAPSQPGRNLIQFSTDKEDATQLPPSPVNVSDVSESQQVQPSTRRSRRLSTGGDDLPQTPTRRSRRLSAGCDDLPLTPARRSRRLSAGGDDLPQTPTRRSRRLSAGEDLADDSSIKSIFAKDKVASSSATPARKSRRLSGAGLIEKPMEVLEEEVEEIDKEKEGQEIARTLSSKSKDDALEVIVENEAESEQESKPELEKEKELETIEERSCSDLKVIEKKVEETNAEVVQEIEISDDEPTSNKESSTCKTKTPSHREAEAEMEDRDIEIVEECTSSSERDKQKVNETEIQNETDADKVNKIINSNAEASEASKGTVEMPKSDEALTLRVSESDDSEIIVEETEAEVKNKSDDKCECHSNVVHEKSDENESTENDVEILEESNSGTDAASKSKDEINDTHSGEKTFGVEMQDKKNKEIEIESDNEVECVAEISSPLKNNSHQNNENNISDAPVDSLQKNDVNNQQDGADKEINVSQPEIIIIKESEVDKDDKANTSSSPSKEGDSDSPETTNRIQSSESSSDENVASSGKEVSSSSSATVASPSTSALEDEAQAKPLSKINGELEVPTSINTGTDENHMSKTTVAVSLKENNENKPINKEVKASKTAGFVVRGMPVSGRWWKEEKKRFKSINKDEGPRSSWAEKMKRKQELKNLKALKTSLEEEKKRKKAELRERQKLNTIRREENEKKSEIVQVIKDSRKIKKMKRKQLRYIETRDTSLIKKS